MHRDGADPAGVAGRFILVDPLDGTREFLSGNGEFTVNIARAIEVESVSLTLTLSHGNINDLSVRVVFRRCQ